MEALGGILGGIYAVGFVVSLVVYRVRAGLGIMKGNRLFGEGGLGLDFMVYSMVKAVGWPVCLGLWLRNDRPEPRIVYNDKARRRIEAEEAKRRRAAEATP